MYTKKSYIYVQTENYRKTNCQRGTDTKPIAFVI